MNRRLVAICCFAASVIGACSSNNDSPSARPSGPRPTRAPVRSRPVSRPKPSPGCGSRPEPGPTASASPTGDVAQTIAVDHRWRSYRLAVPRRYDPRRGSPLILLFHGSGSNAAQMSAYTQLPQRAAARGYLVATPDAIGGNWQLSAPDAHTPDLDLGAALMDALSKRYCVDRSRVFAAGFSNGSGFAAIIGCAQPRRIAAIALASAEFLLKPCRRTVPVIAFHGTKDPLVAYADGGKVPRSQASRCEASN